MGLPYSIDLLCSFNDKQAKKWNSLIFLLFQEVVGWAFINSRQSLGLSHILFLENKLRCPLTMTQSRNWKNGTILTLKSFICPTQRMNEKAQRADGNHKQGRIAAPNVVGDLP